MSGQATGWVLRHGPRDRAQIAVLVVIADAANRDGEHAHPGLDALIDGSRYSRSTVLGTLRKLRATGWVEVTTPRSQGKATEFRIRGVVDPLWEPHDPTTEDPTGPVIGPQDGGLRSNPEGAEVQSGAKHAMSLSFSNGLNNVSTDVDLRAEVNASFTAFWEVYPRRNGKRVGRAEALAVWKRMRPPDRAAAEIGVHHYAAAVADDMTIAKDPHRWLRGRCWGDWQEPAVRDERGWGSPRASDSAAHCLAMTIQERGF